MTEVKTKASEREQWTAHGPTCNQLRQEERGVATEEEQMRCKKQRQKAKPLGKEPDKWKKAKRRQRYKAKKTKNTNHELKLHKATEQAEIEAIEE